MVVHRLVGGYVWYVDHDFDVNVSVCVCVGVRARVSRNTLKFYHPPSC